MAPGALARTWAGGPFPPVLPGSQDAALIPGTVSSHRTHSCEGIALPLPTLATGPLRAPPACQGSVLRAPGPALSPQEPGCLHSGAEHASSPGVQARRGPVGGVISARWSLESQHWCLAPFLRGRPGPSPPPPPRLPAPRGGSAPPDSDWRRGKEALCLVSLFPGAQRAFISINLLYPPRLLSCLLFVILLLAEVWG